MGTGIVTGTSEKCMGIVTGTGTGRGQGSARDWDRITEGKRIGTVTGT